MLTQGKDPLQKHFVGVLGVVAPGVFELDAKLVVFAEIVGQVGGILGLMIA